MTKQRMIAPSILSADFSNMGKAVEDLQSWGADYVHCDVMDGSFVPNITFGQGMIAALKKRTSVPLDVHLMINEPGRHIESFAKAGADILTIHMEASLHLQRELSLIRSLGMKAGVALNPSTPLETLNYVLDDLDLILLMSVNPGFGGQKFVPAVKQKIADLKKIIKKSGKDIILEVDGGVNEANIKELADLGATLFVAGNAVFGKEDPKQALLTLQNA